jgi:hypothetical protein
MSFLKFDSQFVTKSSPNSLWELPRTCRDVNKIEFHVSLGYCLFSE